MGALKTAITDTNVSQVDLVEYLENVKTLVNELKADYNTLRGDFNTLVTKLNADTGVADADYAITATTTAAADLKLTAG